jgi:predicted RNase H-like nuclease
MMCSVEYSEWRSRLEDLISDGLGRYQPARVAAALAAEQSRAGKAADRPAVVPGPASPAPGGAGPDDAPRPLAVTAPVLGLDACSGGWVGVCLRPDERPVVLTARTVAALLDLARTTGPVQLVAIDIPVGLPDAGGRRADALARKALPGKGSSVFSTLTRAAYEAPTYAEAREAQLAATGGTGASAQAYALRAKILEVDGWLRNRPGVEVVEVHPELSFARMAGTPLLARKKDPEGVADRRAALRSAGLEVPGWLSGSGFAEDDLLDAAAAAWTAVRHSQGVAESLPEEPEVFGDGIPAAIRV